MRAREKNWYALYVRSRFEKIVASNLRGKGYEEFLPLYRGRSHWSDGSNDVHFPLVPGYVFCKFDPIERLPILNIPGVNAIAGFDQNFIAVDQAWLSAIRTVLKSGNHCLPCPFVQLGERVRVAYGPLAGIQGIAHHFNKKYDLVISLDMLQRSVAVRIDSDCLRPLSSRSIGHPKSARINIQ
jgi:transcription termination/antitermination protein NusG